MKKETLSAIKIKNIILIVLLVFTFPLHAAYLKNVPTTVYQPNGEILKIFSSGDEFFNYLHDAEGYTIIRHPETGYYVYAVADGQQIVASNVVVGKAHPRSLGVKPHLTISSEEWEARRSETMATPPPPIKKKKRNAKNNDDRNRGHVNNLVIFISFANDTTFGKTYSEIDAMFNDTNATSINTYFKHSTNELLTVSTTLYPPHDGDIILSYVDEHTDAYFRPFDMNSNPQGYTSNEQKTLREHTLLGNAVEATRNYIPESLDIDFNDDGLVDNICFIINCVPGGWNELLWPHRWSLFSTTYTINGKLVYDYNFILSESDYSLSVPTLSHEMFHTFSYPDLYHYGSSSHDPVGPWDIMSGTNDPPQQAGAYTKWKYGNWEPEPTEITEAGTYTLHSVSGRQDGVKCYAIGTATSSERIMLEYRNNNDDFENVPGSGILVYRIDANFDGNASYNGTTIFDEVYIFRPGGDMEVNGNLYEANMGVSERTAFDANTESFPFTNLGDMITDVNISNITLHGDSATFHYSPTYIGDDVLDFTSIAATNHIDLTWELNNNREVMLLGSNAPINTNPVNGINYTVGQYLGNAKVLYMGSNTTFSHQGLEDNTQYYYKMYTKINNHPDWSLGKEHTNFTVCPAIPVPHVEDFEESQELPICFGQTSTAGEDSWRISQGFASGIDGAFSGSSYLMLNNQEGGEDVSVLSLPIFDLTNHNEELALSFAYAAPAWGTDQDKLIISYRNTLDAPFQTLDTLNTNITSWTSKSYVLPNPTATYQILFEGSTHYGHGIFVDRLTVGLASQVGIDENNKATFHVYCHENIIHIENPNLMDIDKIEIVNMMGKIVYSSTTTNNHQTITLQEANGLYFVRINYNNGKTSTHKVTIIK